MPKLEDGLWVVTYVDEVAATFEDPVVTVFDNKVAAYACYSAFLGIHDRVCIDHVPVYGRFTSEGKSYG